MLIIGNKLIFKKSFNNTNINIRNKINLKLFIYNYTKKKDKYYL